jgi:glucokinase
LFYFYTKGVWFGINFIYRLFAPILIQRDMAVIALDLGGTKLAGAVFQPDGKCFNKLILPLERRGGKEVGDLICRMISSQISYADSTGINIESIGCCVPGIAYAETNRVWAPNIPGWENFPLSDTIRDGVHDDKIGVYIDNDRACCMMGEIWQGSAQGCRNAIFLTVGTGIGAGIMADGRILRGSSDIAGAVGWLALDQPYQEKYTACGCFEYHASGDGLARIAREYLQNDPAYDGILKEISPDEITAQIIFDAFHRNDGIAIQVVKKAIVFWGMATANLVSLFNPEKIIFGGGVFGPAVAFLDEIRKEARKWAQPISMNQVIIEASTLGGDAGLIGSACLALTNKMQTNPQIQNYV